MTIIRKNQNAKAKFHNKPAGGYKISEVYFLMEKILP